MSSIIVEEWRDLWSFKVDFVFAACAWVFSAGSFLNFGSLIQNHGGAAFVVAYVGCLLAVCLPIIMMELGVGQLTGRAPIQALFNMCPLFKGVGVAQIIYSLLVLAYVGIRLSYVLLSIFFLFWNIMGPMPWLDCNREWIASPCDNSSNTFEMADLPKASEHSFAHHSVSQYFDNFLINPSNSIEEPGELQWMLISGLGAAWVLVFLAIFAGVRWLGKVCYFSFLIPLVFLMAILVRALTIEQDASPILKLFIPDWSALLETSTWGAAMSRAMYSTGIGMGAFITLGSYNKRNNNLVGDGFLIVGVHLFTVVLQTFATLMFETVFVQDQTLNETLVFNYTEDALLNRMMGAFGSLGVGKLWTAILLFSMAFLYLNTLYVLSLNVLASSEDALGEKSSRCFPRLGLALAVSVLGFAVGLGFTLQSGPYAIQLLSRYLDQLTLWVILTFELLAVGWFYCAHLLGRDIRQMVSSTCGWITGFFCMELLYILPAAPIFVVVMRMMNYWSAKEEIDEVVGTESWVEPVGWVLACLPLLPIPIFMIYIIIRTCLRGPGLTHWQRFKYTIVSPLRYEIVKPSPPPRYNAHAPGYVLLPQAPLAEPEMEQDVYTERVVKVSNI